MPRTSVVRVLAVLAGLLVPVKLLSVKSCTFDFNFCSWQTRGSWKFGSASGQREYYTYVSGDEDAVASIAMDGVPEGPVKLTFWYLITGPSGGQLNVFVSNKHEDQLVWSSSSQSSTDGEFQRRRRWTPIEMRTKLDNESQIRFEATVSRSNVIVALDDVFVSSSPAPSTLLPIRRTSSSPPRPSSNTLASGGHSEENSATQALGASVNTTTLAQQPTRLAERSTEPPPSAYHTSIRVEKETTLDGREEQSFSTELNRINILDFVQSSTFDSFFDDMQNESTDATDAPFDADTTEEAPLGDDASTTPALSNLSEGAFWDENGPLPLHAFNMVDNRSESANETWNPTPPGDALNGSATAESDAARNESLAADERPLTSAVPTPLSDSTSHVAASDFWLDSSGEIFDGDDAATGMTFPQIYVESVYGDSAAFDDGLLVTTPRTMQASGHSTEATESQPTTGLSSTSENATSDIPEGEASTALAAESEKSTQEATTREIDDGSPPLAMATTDEASTDEGTAHSLEATGSSSPSDADTTSFSSASTNDSLPTAESAGNEPTVATNSSGEGSTSMPNAPRNETWDATSTRWQNASSASNSTSPSITTTTISARRERRPLTTRKNPFFDENGPRLFPFNLKDGAAANSTVPAASSSQLSLTSPSSQYSHSNHSSTNHSAEGSTHHARTHFVAAVVEGKPTQPSAQGVYPSRLPPGANRERDNVPLILGLTVCAILVLCFGGLCIISIRYQRLSGRWDLLEEETWTLKKRSKRYGHEVPFDSSRSELTATTPV